MKALCQSSKTVEWSATTGFYTSIRLVSFSNTFNRDYRVSFTPEEKALGSVQYNLYDGAVLLFGGAGYQRVL